ncbi:putative chloroperoxidase [Pisolithus croceorrhizus]|nr:putative chloroperoxidase [Pisolithus croceorrhizus]
MGSPTIIYKAFYYSGIMAWDVALSLLNLVLFKRPVGEVVPEGHPGYAGNWPEYKLPQEGDSRCSCPALNTMANHGIISRSGRGIKFTDLTRQIRTTYNFSCHLLLIFRSVEDSQASSSRICFRLPRESIKEQPMLTIKDMSRFSGKRRADGEGERTRCSHSICSTSFSGVPTTLLTAFGGRVDDLRVFLLEERLPQGWEPRIRSPYGLTILKFNQTIIPLEWGIRESDWKGDASRIEANN